MLLRLAVLEQDSPSDFPRSLRVLGTRYRSTTIQCIKGSYLSLYNILLLFSHKVSQLSQKLRLPGSVLVPLFFQHLHNHGLIHTLYLSVQLLRVHSNRLVHCSKCNPTSERKLLRPSPTPFPHHSDRHTSVRRVYHRNYQTKRPHRYGV